MKKYSFITLLITLVALSALSSCKGGKKSNMEIKEAEVFPKILLNFGKIR